MRIIFQVDGGIGKSVAATAVCKAIRSQYPENDLIVITGYPEVFQCNPNVTRVFNFNDMRYFYEQYVEDGNTLAMLHNPYYSTDFLRRKGHLNEVWCNMNNVSFGGELPELYLTDREINFYSKQLGLIQKPMLAIQTSGGGKDQTNRYSWARDIPTATAQKVVNALKDQYQIMHIRRDDQIALENTVPVQADFRALAVLISMSKKRLFIDSFAQHTAAALGKPSVVCWVANIPSQFGYEMHTNIVANPPSLKSDLRYSVYTKYNISGSAVEFPYRNEDEIFDADEIIAALRTENDVESDNDALSPRDKKRKKAEAI